MRPATFLRRVRSFRQSWHPNPEQAHSLRGQICAQWILYLAGKSILVYQILSWFIFVLLVQFLCFLFKTTLKNWQSSTGKLAGSLNRNGPWTFRLAAKEIAHGLWFDYFSSPCFWFYSTIIVFWQRANKCNTKQQLCCAFQARELCCLDLILPSTIFFPSAYKVPHVLLYASIGRYGHSWHPN